MPVHRHEPRGDFDHPVKLERLPEVPGRAGRHLVEDGGDLLQFLLSRSVGFLSGKAVGKLGMALGKAEQPLAGNDHRLPVGLLFQVLGRRHSRPALVELLQLSLGRVDPRLHALLEQRGEIISHTDGPLLPHLRLDGAGKTLQHVLALFLG